MKISKNYADFLKFQLKDDLTDMVLQKKKEKKKKTSKQKKL